MLNIFEEEPHQWGLRGDPYLWHALREYIAVGNQPVDIDDFDRLFKEAFMAITGDTLSPGKEVFVKSYDKGGMSSGFISTDFWIEIALPLLKERFSLLKS